MSYARRPIWIITYQGVKDVSNEIGAMVTSVDYTDHVTSKSDEISVTVANDDLRWIKGWFPNLGDTLEVHIGWEGEPLLKCGVFKLDKVDMSGTLDVVTLHGLAAGIGVPVRTAQSRAFEATTLRDIADVIARELELELEGDIADISLGRVSMDQETTLAFLRRLAQEYGYAFSIRDKRLSFYELAALEKSPPVMTIARKDLRPGYRVSAKVGGTYVACEAAFFDPETKTTKTIRVEEEKPREIVVLNAAGEPVDGAPPVIPRRTLRDGVTGDDVRGWQDFLSSQGIDPGPVDGIFGPRTRAATIVFQRNGGVAQDGVVGSETIRVAVGAGFDLRTTIGAPKPTHTEPAGNVLKTTIRVESIEQAELKAKAALAKANRLKATGTIPLIGNQRLVAGLNIELTDMGRLSGHYSIETSKHHMTRTGYETELEVKFVP